MKIKRAGWILNGFLILFIARAFGSAKAAKAGCDYRANDRGGLANQVYAADRLYEASLHASVRHFAHRAAARRADDQPACRDADCLSRAANRERNP